MISFCSVLHGGNMKGDFGWEGLAGRQGCERYSWLAEGRRLAGRRGGCRLMFHLLFVPRYLDYVPADLGGLLRPVTKLSGRAFSFHCVSTSPPLSLSNAHPSFSFLVILTLLTHPVTSYHMPKSLFLFLFIHPSIHVPPFLHPALFPQLCFPLFCGDIKQLTACLVAGLQCAGRRVLLSLCIYRYFVSQSLCDYFHYAGFRDFHI